MEEKSSGSFDSLDFARDFACGLRRPQARLNFDSAPVSLNPLNILEALRSG
jgi:hypothetical protein